MTKPVDYEYRLSWESIPPHDAIVLDQQFGRHLADKVPSELWDALPWQPPTVTITTYPWDQYQALSEWARTRDHPIRNVTLERRVRPNPDEGWERYEDNHMAAKRIAEALTPGTPT